MDSVTITGVKNGETTLTLRQGDTATQVPVMVTDTDPVDDIVCSKAYLTKLDVVKRTVSFGFETVWQPESVDADGKGHYPAMVRMWWGSGGVPFSDTADMDVETTADVPKKQYFRNTGFPLSTWRTLQRCRWTAEYADGIRRSAIWEGTVESTAKGVLDDPDISDSRKPIARAVLDLLAGKVAAIAVKPTLGALTAGGSRTLDVATAPAGKDYDVSTSNGNATAARDGGHVAVTGVTDGDVDVTVTANGWSATANLTVRSGTNLLRYGPATGKLQVASVNPDGSLKLSNTTGALGYWVLTEWDEGVYDAGDYTFSMTPVEGVDKAQFGAALYQDGAMIPGSRISSDNPTVTVTLNTPARLTLGVGFFQSNNLPVESLKIQLEAGKEASAWTKPALTDIEGGGTGSNRA